MGNNKEYNVFLLPKASKELERLPQSVQTQIREYLKLLKFPYQIAAKKLKGSEDSYRIRVGDYRIIYKIYEDEVIVLIIRIARRKSVYKRKF